ncbi:MAG TPA: hypothetical protein PKA63_08660 [Oligoflexia bacterium]|nr:hypothetical protein [Oligoflexia bacterium]HMP48722.1 hypothetical protein [Oligoflexia bacterium]
MNDISKEFKLNPLMTLVPVEGELSSLKSHISKLLERHTEIENLLLDSHNYSGNKARNIETGEPIPQPGGLDENTLKDLSAEKEMLDTVRKWIGR